MGWILVEYRACHQTWNWVLILLTGCVIFQSSQSLWVLESQLQTRDHSCLGHCEDSMRYCMWNASTALGSYGRSVNISSDGGDHSSPCVHRSSVNVSLVRLFGQRPPRPRRRLQKAPWGQSRSWDKKKSMPQAMVTNGNVWPSEDSVTLFSSISRQKFSHDTKAANAPPSPGNEDLDRESLEMRLSADLELFLFWVRL